MAHHTPPRRCSSTGTTCPTPGVPATACHTNSHVFVPRRYPSPCSKVVRAATSAAPKAAILTHCSAGVGRTGTFIAIDRLLNAVDHSDAEWVDVNKV